jgi:hypothetical protein
MTAVGRKQSFRGKSRLRSLHDCFVPIAVISRIKKAPILEPHISTFLVYFLRLIPANPINAEPNSQAAAGTGTLLA